MSKNQEIEVDYRIDSILRESLMFAVRMRNDQQHRG
jgi:hypothetical protein